MLLLKSPSKVGLAKSSCYHIIISTWILQEKNAPPNIGGASVLS
jgi:hypothetical protein